MEMQNLLIKFIKKNAFKKYYNKYPKKINDVYIMVNRVKKYLKENGEIFQ